MKYISDSVTLVFDDKGKSFSSILEQIFKILINSTEEGETKCIMKQ